MNLINDFAEYSLHRGLLLITEAGRVAKILEVAKDSLLVSTTRDGRLIEVSPTCTEEDGQITISIFNSPVVRVTNIFPKEGFSQACAEIVKDVMVMCQKHPYFISRHDFPMWADSKLSLDLFKSYEYYNFVIMKVDKEKVIANKLLAELKQKVSDLEQQLEKM